MNNIIISSILTLLICDAKSNSYKTKIEKEEIPLQSNYNNLTLLNQTLYESNNLNNIPEAFDWRKKNIIFPTLQGSSYYTLWKEPTFEMLELLYAKKKGKAYSFSRQMIIDCLSNINDSIEDTLDWIKKYGIMLEEDYPYKGIKGICRINQSKFIDMKVIDYVKLPSPVNEELMKEYLNEISYLPVGINNKFAGNYAGGIIDLDEDKCPPTKINQAVILVGYGTTSGKDYWIVKTNFGKSWGESGYCRIAKGKGICGINQYVIIPKIKFE